MLKLKLAVLWLQIRAMEAHADGQTRLLALVADIHTRHRMKMAHVNLLNEITRTKAEYRRIKRGAGIQPGSYLEAA